MNIRARLERLERHGTDSPTVLIWVEHDETQEEALISRYGAGPYPEHVMFIGWARTPDEATPDPAGDARCQD
jgi:hypothetical protein